MKKKKKKKKTEGTPRFSVNLSNIELDLVCFLSKLLQERPDMHPAFDGSDTMLRWEVGGVYVVLAPRVLQVQLDTTKNTLSEVQSFAIHGFCQGPKFEVYEVM